MKSGKKGGNSKARDIVLILALLALGLALLLFVRLGGRQGAFAVVEINGSETGRYSLSEDGVYELVDGGNILEISDGRARIVEATCPDELCVKMGWIRFSGQSIVCLPHRLVVKIVGGDSLVDIVN